MSADLRRKAWLVMLSGTGINLALGILYTWSVFKKAIAADTVTYPWGESNLALPYSVCLAVFAFSMILAGRVQDRFGPRVTAMIGGVLVAIGFIFASFSSALWSWVLCYGVLFGAGVGFGYASATPPALKWFPAKKTGMVAGIVVSGFGLAAAIWAPVTSALLNGGMSMQTIMLVYGILFAVILGVLSLFLKNPAEGYNANETFGIEVVGGAKAAAPQRDVPPSQVVTRARFWLLWTMYAIGAGAGLMVIGDISGMAKTALDHLAWIAVVILAVGNASGRIGAGMLSDRLGRRQTLLIMLLFQAVLMFLAMSIIGTGQAALLLVLATLVGFNYGTNLSLFPAFAKDRWGLKHFGVNYGMLFTAWGVGGLILMELYQRMKAAGLQSTAFIIVGVLLLIAAAMTFTVRKEPKGMVSDDPEPKDAPTESTKPDLEEVGAS
jgi:MFS family permease